MRVEQQIDCLASSISGGICWRYKKKCRLRWGTSHLVDIRQTIQAYWYIPASIAVGATIIGGAFLIHSWSRTVSFELHTKGDRGSPRQEVTAWLNENRAEIAREAAHWRVNPNAVAGVIAYEALEDPLPGQFARVFRFSGPGKVHYKEYFTSEGDPVAKQVEDVGYLPRLTEAQRQSRLSRSTGAIQYICAIMRYYSDIAASHHLAISENSGTLATLYSAWAPASYRRYLQTDRGRRGLFSPNNVGQWVLANMPYIRNALASRPNP